MSIKTTQVFTDLSTRDLLKAIAKKEDRSIASVLRRIVKAEAIRTKIIPKAI
jgi:hypothetical protein